jgi:hypothetical protein
MISCTILQAETQRGKQNNETQGAHTMTTAKAMHTPGPWKIVTAWPYEVRKGDGATCHRIADCRDYNCIAYTKENEANARLIAAAPDLLSALKKIVEGGMPLNPQLLDAFRDEPSAAFNDRKSKYLREWKTFNIATSAISQAEGK